jgi:hypothetical protein
VLLGYWRVLLGYWRVLFGLPAGGSFFAYAFRFNWLLRSFATFSFHGAVESAVGVDFGGVLEAGGFALSGAFADDGGSFI